jgi:hypothetical protein
MESNSFPYIPLSEDDFIRLLHLEPAESVDTPLHGRLVHTTIRERANDIYAGYIALSYVWGDPSQKGSIVVEGLPVIITASLEAALRGIRHTALACRIWADALCIDQENISERNSQVILMGSIYETADHTVIFLGPLTPDAESVLSKAADLGSISEELAGNSEAVALAKRDILLRPWFKRTWVLQELVLSQDPWVQCGRLRAQWVSLCALLLGTKAAEGPSRKPLHPPRTSSLHTLIAMNDARSRRKGNDLFELLRTRRGFEATDHRDIIYALLGLVEDDQRQIAGAVDYTLPVQRAFFLAACNFLRRRSNGGLEALLSDAGAAGPSVDPSWVPNWALPAYTMPFPEVDNRIEFGIGPLRGRYYEIVPDPPILLSLGLPLGVIKALGPVFPPASSVDRLAAYRALSALEKNTTTMAHVFARRNPWAERYTEAWVNLLKDITAKHGPQCADISKNFPLFLEGFSKQAERFSTKPTGMEDNIFHPQMDRYLLDGMPHKGNHKLGKYELDILELSHEGAKPVLEGRRFAITQEGVLATVPAHAQLGDICVWFFKTKKQFICRPVPTEKSAKAQEERLAGKEAVLEAARKLLLREEHQWLKVSMPVAADAYVRLVGECVVGEEALGPVRYPWPDMKIYALK